MKAALSFLRENGINNNDIILWGLSLGGPVAADAASKEHFRAVILQSTFTNIKDAAISVYQRKVTNRISLAAIKAFFENLICYQKYDTDKKITKISSPLLLLHSKDDEMIPVEMTYKLSKLNPHSKVFISSGNGHNDIYWAYEKVFEFVN